MAPPARAEAIPPAIAPNIITPLKWLETNNLFNNLIQRNQSAAFSSGKVRQNHETNINIIARRTGKDVNSHTVLDGIITTSMATIQRINIIGSRQRSRNRRRLKANQTGKKGRVGIKSNISTNRNNLISSGDRCIHLNAMKKTTITSINLFFSSRRRHTRFDCDWSSDVCSSDLNVSCKSAASPRGNSRWNSRDPSERPSAAAARARSKRLVARQRRAERRQARGQLGEIGRASCRERV